jgi:NAD(P)-dependent dehydrogenase (short-subunit alcohol dehydrogenase family)
VRLKGARVVVTGAGSGIGAATARRFAGAGSQVVAVDIDGAAAEQTAAACAELGPSGHAERCDVADAAALAALAARIEDEHGPVDVLVNNAGVGIAGPFLSADTADWNWIRSINLDGVAYGCQAFGPAMVARGHGHVVNVASGAAFVPNRHMAAYCATKAAVVMLSQCLRADWRPHGVGVSVVCPGLINTPIHRTTRYRGSMDGRQARAEKVFSYGRSPDAVAKAVQRCVVRNRDVVPVGMESSLGDLLLRPAPRPVQALFARTQL